MKNPRSPFLGFRLKQAKQDILGFFQGRGLTSKIFNLYSFIPLFERRKDWFFRFYGYSELFFSPIIFVWEKENCGFLDYLALQFHSFGRGKSLAFKIIFPFHFPCLEREKNCWLSELVSLPFPSFGRQPLWDSGKHLSLREVW